MKYLACWTLTQLTAVAIALAFVGWVLHVAHR